MSVDFTDPARSYLFVPGNRPDRFAKAFGAGADAVVMDLEDAVASDEKAAARAAIAAWFAGNPNLGTRLVVRINDHTSDWFDADLELLRAFTPCCVMLPKAESVPQLEHLASALGPGSRVIALIETARGVLAADAIAQAPSVHRLAFGTLDYALDLCLSDDPRGLLYPASRIAIASRSAGLPPPIAGITAAFNDDAALLADFELARGCGFGAKMCIHPRQIAPVHEAMAPSAEQFEWATRVVAAARDGAGAVQVDGKMVDRPVLLKAKAMLAYRPHD